jgi:multicomponent K+:H+ antiporter subunit G
MPLLVDLLIGALLLVGAAFALVGAWGLARLSDFFKRLHGPTKASTLGVGCVLVASMLYFTFRPGSAGVALHELLVTLIIFLTAPVAAHLLVQAALALDPGARPPPPQPAGQEGKRAD